MPLSGLHVFLKLRTSACHKRVDAAFSRFDLGTESGLEGYLTAQAAALLPLESAIEAASDGVTALIGDWADRRRSHLLADLRLATPVVQVPKLPGLAAGFGVLYVLEGSKLGARFLRKRVSQAAGPFARASASFLGYGREAGDWTSFLHQLEAAGDKIDREVCLRAAVEAFAHFELAATIVADRQAAASRELAQAATVSFKHDPRQYKAPDRHAATVHREPG